MFKSAVFFSLATAGYMNQSKGTSDCSPADVLKKGVCILDPQPGQKAKGVVFFEQEGLYQPTKIRAEFTGLDYMGIHGFHIHTWGDLTNGCLTAGPHFNPFNTRHGAAFSAIRHVGDLGNVFADADGKGVYTAEDPQVQLSGKHSVIGRACVLHKFPDDLGFGGTEESQKTGSAGPRIACGVIGLRQN